MMILVMVGACDGVSCSQGANGWAEMTQQRRLLDRISFLPACQLCLFHATAGVELLDDAAHLGQE